MLQYLFIALSVLLQSVVYIFALSFGFWLYRRVPTRSFPWIGAYLLLGSPLLTYLNRWLLQVSGVGRIFPVGIFSSFGSRTSLWTQFLMVNQILMAISQILLMLLLASDIIFFLQKTGVEADNAAVRRVLMIRNFSLSLGLGAVCITLLSQLMMLLLPFL